MSGGRLEGLAAALELSPENHALRLLLAEELESAGRGAEALAHYERLLAESEIPGDAAVRAGGLAAEAGRLQLAARCLRAASEAGELDGVAALRSRLERALSEEEPTPSGGGLAGLDLDSEADVDEEEEPVSPFRADSALEAGPRVTFADVGGLDAVKRNVHRTIILPFQRPDLYLRYGRRAGGGAMLYGPPGCGKTLMARATAGECGLPFFNVRIEDVLSPYTGVSEGNLHAAFAEARAAAPCVLFLDELDALAFARRKQAGASSRSLVDQLLQELDAIGSDNRGVLVLSATNAPWDVDDGLKRPGRLDHLSFVPPPDRESRERILSLLLEGRPTAGIDIRRLGRRTALFSGADLSALVERAVDAVIEEALESGEEPPLTMRHLEDAATAVRPTTLDWLASARNYVEFANEAGRYDEVAAFLRTKEAKTGRE